MDLAMFSRRSPVSRIAWVMSRALVLLLLSGLAAAALIRIAPGFGVDERALDPRLSARTHTALEREHSGERNPVTFYVRFLSALLHGDAGRSTVFGQPVAVLIRERAPTTIRTVSTGLALGWSTAVLLAVAGVLSGRGAALTAFGLSGALLSVPSALLATVCLLAKLPPGCAIAAVIFPRVFPHTYEQLRAGLGRPHVLMARAKGLPAGRVFLFHVVPTTLLPVLALAGVSAVLAFGASIPVEALADSPGIGQLAWRAALGRDLSVLVMITLLLTAITLVANALADVASAGLRRTAP
jgi:peptide/nickel transport system permease protein